jgi:hypothetical protein
MSGVSDRGFQLPREPRRPWPSAPAATPFSSSASSSLPTPPRVRHAAPCSNPWLTLHIRTWTTCNSRPPLKTLRRHPRCGSSCTMVENTQKAIVSQASPRLTAQRVGQLRTLCFTESRYVCPTVRHLCAALTQFTIDDCCPNARIGLYRQLSPPSFTEPSAKTLSPRTSVSHRTMTIAGHL